VNEDSEYLKARSEQYLRTFHVDGVHIVTRNNHFEVFARKECNISEQQLVQMLRQWMRERQERIRKSFGPR
jgi:hypothetical protein